ncbi:MAG: dihydropteroate synthase [Wenzhouxiangellaceae bacterium]
MNNAELIRSIDTAAREGRCLVMGILNVTPDSFSDGGRYTDLDAALDQARRMVADGALIIDVGGESTRPGADPVSTEVELARVIPVIEALTATLDCAVSIDTMKPEVMRAAVHAGAAMINDVNALRAPGAAEVAADLDAAICLMHMQGEPRTMQKAPVYDDVVEDVYRFFADRIQSLTRSGIDPARLVLDPGFGFGKTLAHNLQLLAGFRRFQTLGRPLLAGLSRKSMLGQITGRDEPGQRVSASVAAALLAAERGATILRVHDVAETVDALKVLEALYRQGPHQKA